MNSDSFDGQIASAVRVVADEIRRQLDEKSAARDRSLASSRSAVRSCSNAIRAMHRYDEVGARRLLDEAAAHLQDARGSLAGHDDVLHAGFVHDAEKEYAEAHITFALITEGEFPDHRGLGVPSTAFLKGMAESIGEIRRHILDLMRRGELERCERLLLAVDDMYYVLTSMDYPDAVTHGLRRLTDVARSIIERTRGDYTVSKLQAELRIALERPGRASEEKNE